MWNLELCGPDEKFNPKTEGAYKGIEFFFENCANQNKNMMFLRLIIFMVKNNIYRQARDIFIVYGHTKNDCNHLFNLLKIWYYKQNI